VAWLIEDAHLCVRHEGVVFMVSQTWKKEEVYVPIWDIDLDRASFK